MTIEETASDEQPTGLGRRALLTRMAVGGAMVWASPLITSTAHAQTAGTCEPGTVVWRSFNGGSTSVIPIGSSGFNAQATNVMHGTDIGQQSGDLLIETWGGNPPGANTPWLVLWNTIDHPTPGGWNAGGRTFTITFSQPVNNVSFYITDIDRNAGQYYDYITLVPDAGTFTVTPLGPTNDRVTGTGAPGNPLRRGSNTSNVAESSLTGRVRVEHPGPLTTITIRYWNELNISGGGSSQQAVLLSNINFGCGTAGLSAPFSMASLQSQSLSDERGYIGPSGLYR